MVTSVAGNAVVNLDSVVGQFTAISAATGDVNVNLRTGDLTIGQLSGRNIAVEVANGSIETGAGGSPSAPRSPAAATASRPRTSSATS